MLRGLVGWRTISLLIWLPLARALSMQPTEVLEEARPYVPILLPQRPMFVFAHIEKSAGSFLQDLFKAAVPKSNYHFFHNAWDDVGDKLMGMPRVPDNYFVVSSFRNPCHAMLSQWSYCCERTWGGQYIPDMARWDCGKDYMTLGLCPQFSFKDGKIDRAHIITVDKNVAGFHRVLANNTCPTYDGFFNITMEDIGPKRVNCWVRVDNLEESARKCLREYEQLTGNKVNYAALDGKFAYSNAGQHGDCSEYFTPEAEQRVRERNPIVFNYFGITSCCNSIHVEDNSWGDDWD